MMDTGESMCCGECCVLFKTDESHTCTPETNNTLYVNNLKKDIPSNYDPTFIFLKISNFLPIC